MPTSTLVIVGGSWVVLLVATVIYALRNRRTDPPDSGSAAGRES